MLTREAYISQSYIIVLSIIDIVGTVALGGSAIALFALTALVRPVWLPTFIPYNEFAVIDDQLAVQYRLAVGPHVYPGHALAVICLIGAIQHLISLLTARHQWDGIRKGFNWMVWPEFAITSALSVMVLCWVLGTLTFFEFLTYGVSTLIACVICFFIEADGYFNGPRTSGSIQMVVNVWGPTVIAMILALVPWIPFVVQFAFSVNRSISNVPWWVIVSSFGTFALFAGVAATFFLQRLVLSDSSWPCAKKPALFRIAYAGLGILSKLVIAWVIAGGILQQNVLQQ